MCKCCVDDERRRAQIRQCIGHLNRRIGEMRLSDLDAQVVQQVKDRRDQAKQYLEQTRVTEVDVLSATEFARMAGGWIEGTEKK